MNEDRETLASTLVKVKDYHSDGDDAPLEDSIRSRIRDLLNKKPWLSPKQLCYVLGLPYPKYAGYIRNVKSEWKHHSGNEQGSLCSVHGWRGWTYVPVGVPSLDIGGDWSARSAALLVGWKATRSRNRCLLWKDALGRLMWQN
jgi:hypothetical protein